MWYEEPLNVLMWNALNISIRYWYPVSKIEIPASFIEGNSIKHQSQNNCFGKYLNKWSTNRAFEFGVNIRFILQFWCTKDELCTLTLYLEMAISNLLSNAPINFIFIQKNLYMQHVLGLNNTYKMMWIIVAIFGTILVFSYPKKYPFNYLHHYANIFIKLIIPLWLHYI